VDYTSTATQRGWLLYIKIK